MPRKFIPLAIGMGLAIAGVSYAQTPDPVRFIVSPEVPGPGETVRIEAQGVGTFLGESTITWQEDGKTSLSGVGERVFTFTTGNLGATTRVHAIIESRAYGTITKNFSFTPTLINLLWEADTSVPPLYLGKALYSAGSRIRVVAFPQVVAGGTTVSSNNLSFRWSINGEPATQFSGKGRSSITIQGGQLRSGEQVSVDVYLGDVRVGRGSVFITATDPLLLLYNKDPLRGVLYDQAFPGSVTLLGQEMSIKAEPYYFSTESINSGTINYAWTLNNFPTAGPDSSKGILTLRREGDGAGQASVGVSLQNTDTNKFIQSARAALRVFFGQSSGNTSSFGI